MISLVLRLVLLSAVMIVEDVRAKDPPVLSLKDCKSPDSVLIDCACDSFLGDINKVIEKIFNHYNFTELNARKGSIMEILSAENFGPFLKSILNNAQDMCGKTTAFHNCLVEHNFDSSTHNADVYAKHFVPSADNVKMLFEWFCGIVDEIQPNVNCVAEKVLPASGCVISVIPSAFVGLRLNSSSPNFGSELVDTFCPTAGDMLKCFGAQVFPCSGNLSSDLIQMSQSLVPSCKAKMNQGSNTIFSSPVVYCGLGIYEYFLNDTNSSPSLQQFKDLISIACRMGPTYFQCVAREYPKSKSIIDINMQEMIDYYQLRMSLFQPLCDEKQELAKTIECAMNKTVNNKLGNCFPKNNTGISSTDFTAKVIGANTIRTQFCTPFHDTISCFLNVIQNSCSNKIGTLGHRIFPELLRLECNGIRRTTPQSIQRVTVLDLIHSSRRANEDDVATVSEYGITPQTSIPDEGNTLDNSGVRMCSYEMMLVILANLAMLIFV